jgi:hypothetical protein
VGLLDMLQSRIHGSNWPPTRELAERWEQVSYYRARFKNDKAELLQHTPRFHSQERASYYLPVPVGRDVCRYSAQLLFSQPAQISYADDSENAATLQTALDEILRANLVDSFFQESAERVATEGIGAFRIVWDDEAAKGPTLTYLPDDKVIWDIRHGRFVMGGTAIEERELNPGSGVIYRLLEEHTAGKITRKLFKGRAGYLGSEVSLDTIGEFAGYEEEEDTGLDTSTLVLWRNVPGGYSDMEAIIPLLESVDESTSELINKMRKSQPYIFADRSLADERGRVTDAGVILTGEEANVLPEIGENKSLPIELLQPEFRAEEHIRAIRALRELALTTAGYSLASYGLDDGGSADSGKALHLRQTRTLLARAGKEKMAVDAISRALAICVAWKLGAQAVDEFRPRIELGDGQPDDPLETAQEIATLRGADAISTEQVVRTLHEDWSQGQIDLEVAAIESGTPEDPVLRSLRDVGLG